MPQNSISAQLPLQLEPLLDSSNPLHLHAPGSSVQLLNLLSLDSQIKGNLESFLDSPDPVNIGLFEELLKGQLGLSVSDTDALLELSRTDFEFVAKIAGLYLLREAPFRFNAARDYELTFDESQIGKEFWDQVVCKATLKQLLGSLSLRPGGCTFGLDQNDSDEQKLYALMRQTNKSSKELLDVLPNIQQIEEIRIDHCGLTELPSCFDSLIFPNLTELVLRNNNLKSVPDGVFNQVSLMSLSLSGNQIRSISADIGNLQNCFELLIRNNKLSDLPKEMGKLKSLEYLDLGTNDFHFVPEVVFDLANLINLDLSHNPNCLISDKILNLPKLKTLGLSPDMVVCNQVVLDQLKARKVYLDIR